MLETVVSLAPLILYLRVQGGVPVRSIEIFVEEPSSHISADPLVMVAVGRLSTPIVNLRVPERESCGFVLIVPEYWSPVMPPFPRFIHERFHSTTLNLFLEMASAGMMLLVASHLRVTCPEEAAGPVISQYSESLTTSIGAVLFSGSNPSSRGL